MHFLQMYVLGSWVQTPPPGRMVWSHTPLARPLLKRTSWSAFFANVSQNSLKSSTKEPRDTDLDEHFFANASQNSQIEAPKKPREQQFLRAQGCRRAS